MAPAAAPTSDVPSDKAPPRWGLNTPHIRRVLKYIKSKGAVTAEQLVEWDASHGRRLFTWDEPTAAAEWRLYEARLFLNRFRAKWDGMRVRAFIHIREDEEHGIDRDAYYSVEAISQNTSMRAQVVGEITKRMANLAE